MPAPGRCPAAGSVRDGPPNLAGIRRLHRRPRPRRPHPPGFPAALPAACWAAPHRPRSRVHRGNSATGHSWAAWRCRRQCPAATRRCRAAWHARAWPRTGPRTRARAGTRQVPRRCHAGARRAGRDALGRDALGIEGRAVGRLTDGERGAEGRENPPPPPPRYPPPPPPPRYPPPPPPPPPRPPPPPPRPPRASSSPVTSRHIDARTTTSKANRFMTLPRMRNDDSSFSNPNPSVLRPQTVNLLPRVLPHHDHLVDVWQQFARHLAVHRLPGK